MSEPLSIFYLSELFVTTVARAFLSFSIHVNQFSFISIVQSAKHKAKRKYEILSNGCHTSNVLSTRPSLQQFSFFRQHIHVHVFCNGLFAHHGTSHTRIVIIYLIKQYFSGIFRWVFTYLSIVRSSPSRGASTAEFPAPSSLSSQRHNQFHYMKLNWWLIAIPIYP